MNEEGAYIGNHCYGPHLRYWPPTLRGDSLLGETVARTGQYDVYTNASMYYPSPYTFTHVTVSYP